MVVAIGVGAQFLQRSDPTPPLLYYTVLSALGLSAVLLLELRTRGRGTDWLRGLMLTGLVFSAIVYALVLLPFSRDPVFSPRNHDHVAQVATVALHAVAPTIGVLDLVRRPIAVRRRVAVAAGWLVWPAVYFSLIVGLAEFENLRAPYTFMDPSAAPSWNFGLANLCLALVSFGVGCAVAALAGHLKVARDSGSVGRAPGQS
ncbi:MAG: hypothetical protein KGN78_13635 [Actinomycetales bacterium]|nr:hypothetical protein [Actinomycetales bacterium]